MGKTIELIESHTVTGASVLSVSLTSIPQTFNVLELVMTARTNASVNMASLEFNFNGDTTVSNYYRYFVETYYGGSLTNYIYSGNASGNSWMQMPGDTPGGQTAGNMFGRVIIPNYSQTTLKKSMKFVSGYEIDTSAIANWRCNSRLGSGAWDSTAAITQIDITSPTATDVFRANTTNFTLFGWQDS
jgi:hypothetical protein